MAGYAAWLDELAEAFPDEEWLQPAEGSETDYEPRQWHGLYFRAFDALRYDRPYGAFGGQMPINYVAMSTYARDHGITGSAFKDFLLIVSQLDRVFLKMEEERQKSTS